MKRKKAAGLTVITTHTNADFDALGSLLAAQKLYPDGLVIFPGSQEKNLRNFFINSMAYLFNMGDVRTIDFDRISRLVLVDTRQPGRIGSFAPLLKRKDVEVHVFDHHPPTAGDITGDLEVHRLTGATVTLLTEILQARNIAVSADEATIMCLGVYEDTGSFTFPSTTDKDLAAAAFLVSRGANLNIIANLISREISPEQLSVLNDMLQSARHFDINGVDVVITTVTMEGYMPDFAFLVHKMVRMENLDVIFAIANMANKIYLVGRSRIGEVDVGQIATLMGGGGHTFAAAASIKGKTLVQAEHQLLEILYKTVRSSRQARDLMSSPAIFVAPEVLIQEAADLLTRYNINTLLVVEKRTDGNRLLGYISRQVIEKALYHKLDTVPVSEYMTPDVGTVGPEASLTEIQDQIIERKQRLLPVVDPGGEVIGVITRTDLLNTLVHQARQGPQKGSDPLKDKVHARTRNITKFMRERLEGFLLDLLQSIGRVADELGYAAYVVGGFVRDLFLYRPNEDMDIVIEGDGIAFARRFATLHGARIHSHAKFGTAVVIFPSGFKIDVASARLEYYQSPAALPTVEMSSIKLDLFRRDFTVNTLAIQLSPAAFGTLIDFFAGQRDLKEKTIRVLHNLSFVEDPTRVFRAIRFEQRFDFTIGKLTEGLIKNAVTMDFFKRLSGRRVFNELRQIFEEENPIPAVLRLNDFDLLKVIHPSVCLTGELRRLLNSVKKVLSWHDLLFLEETYLRWAVYILALVQGTDAKVTGEICDRLEFAPRHRSIFLKERFDAQSRLRYLEHRLPMKNSDLYHQLAGFRTELALFMMAATQSETVKRAISFFFTNLRNVKISVSGADVKALGIAPGPVYGRILGAVLDARLNGELQTREDELAYLERHVSGL